VSVLADGGSASRQRFLRYWALNVTIVYQSGWDWIPLFPYTPAEKQRLAELAANASPTRTAVWLAAATVIGLVLLIVCALALGFALLSGLGLIWPDVSKTPAPAMFAGLGLASAVSVSLAMPLAIGFGGAAADAITDGPAIAPQPQDAALYAKVRTQFVRLPFILAPLVLIGCLGWQLALGR
jgi:hypothetical protein